MHWIKSLTHGYALFQSPESGRGWGAEAHVGGRSLCSELQAEPMHSMAPTAEPPMPAKNFLVREGREKREERHDQII